MLKKVSLFILVLCVSTLMFAQKTKTTYSDPVKLAKETALEAQGELLTTMKQYLSGEGKGKKAKFEGLEEKKEQFLYDEDKIIEVLKLKDKNLQKNELAAVYSALCNKGGASLIISKRADLGKIDTMKVANGKKAGQYVIKNGVAVQCVPITFEVRTTSKDNQSDVKYEVTFIWEVMPKPKTEKDEDGNAKVVYRPNGVKLVSSEAKRIDYLTSEKLFMQAAAQEAIVKWYNETLPSIYMNQFAELKPLALCNKQVQNDDIKVTLPDSPTFVVKDNLPEIKVEIDPYQCLSGKNPDEYVLKAYVRYKPVIKVKVDQTYKEASIIEVTFGQGEVIKPESKDAILLADERSKNFVGDYMAKLQDYTSEDFMSLFESEDTPVAISKIYSNGKVKTVEKPVREYVAGLKKLKDVKITNRIQKEIIPEFNHTVFTCELYQEFRSKNYNDDTIKRVHFSYDKEKGCYVTKVEVISTEKK